jgi:eukaryotic-like serine/threonine-protein kinase
VSAAVVAPTPRGTTYLLYLRDDALVAHEFDERAGEVRGSPRMVVDGIGTVANPPLMPTIGVSASGVLAYQTGAFGSAVLTWFSRTGERLGTVPLEVPGSTPSLSPDGRFLAVTATSRSERDVWVTDLARGVTSRLTRGGVRTAVWSPDSRRLAFFRSGKIYVKPADGSTDETILADVAGIPRSWSADGKYLLYETAEGKLFLWPLAGAGTPIAVGSREGRSRGGRLSPDSRYIAFNSDESGREEVYIQRLPPATGRVQVSASGGIQPRWGPTGRELFFLSADRAMMAVDVHLGDVPSAGVPRKLFQLDSSAAIGYDVSVDGQRFLVDRFLYDLPNAPIMVVLNWWAELAKRQN